MDGINYSIDDVRQALILPDFDPEAALLKMLPGQRPRQRPEDLEGQARLGGVLALLYFKRDELHVVLTRRRDDLHSHAGQISFPGGSHENAETMVETALRETEEEIGVQADRVEVLGKLTPIYIPPSDFVVHPFVGWYPGGTPVFDPNPDEVAEVLEVPLRTLLDPATQVETEVQVNGFRLRVPVFLFESHKVWGATAVMLNELLERLRTLALMATLPPGA